MGDLCLPRAHRALKEWGKEAPGFSLRSGAFEARAALCAVLLRGQTEKSRQAALELQVVLGACA
eukprot:9196587-Pyramimonas_sp.AAC.1